MVREEWYFMVKATRKEKSEYQGTFEASKWTNLDSGKTLNA